MDLESYRVLIRSMVSSGITGLDVLGGEPTLHPHLHEMLSLCGAHGIRTTLSTNGLNVEALHVLSGMVESGFLRIGVSLNDEGVSDALNEYILAHRPLLKSVCTADRVIPGAARAYLGNPRIEYFLIYLDTLSREDLAKSMPFYEFFDRLTWLTALHGNVKGVYCSGFVTDQEDSRVQRVRCPAGTTKLSVMPDGDIYPCYLLMDHREFRLGNIRDDTFSSIMSRPVLQLFRRYEGNPCSQSGCALIGSCHGGCPAISLRINGTLSCADPRCGGARQLTTNRSAKH